MQFLVYSERLLTLLWPSDPIHVWEEVHQAPLEMNLIRLHEGPKGEIWKRSATIRTHHTRRQRDWILAWSMLSYLSHFRKYMKWDENGKSVEVWHQMGSIVVVSASTFRWVLAAHCDVMSKRSFSLKKMHGCCLAAHMIELILCCAAYRRTDVLLYFVK